MFYLYYQPTNQAQTVSQPSLLSVATFPDKLESCPVAGTWTRAQYLVDLQYNVSWGLSWGESWE